MNTIQHPILDMLINEDGTLIIYQGKELKVRTRDDSKNYGIRQVSFAGRESTVAKLVCEAWNGMRQDMSQVVCRKDYDHTNDHYTNLFWGSRGHNIFNKRSKRSKLSKVKKNEIPEVIRRINAGEPLNNIGHSYNTTGTSIKRIKNRWITDYRLKLREDVIKAKTPHDKMQAYAKYLGYKTVAEAIKAYGQHRFKMAMDEIAVTL